MVRSTFGADNSKNKMKIISILLIALSCSILASAQEPEILDAEAEKAAVIDIVEQFITAAGNYDIGAIQTLFSDKANIGGASLKNGKWTAYTMTIQEFLDTLISTDNPTKYTEPVYNFTVHMDKGMLAFVKADAILKVNGEPKANNFDYFTLIKVDGKWKILNGSYVSVPIKN